MLLPGRGSAEMIATGLCERHVGSLRFDKVGSGDNMQPLEVLSLSHYVDEVRAAFEALAARPDCSSITLVGHSEGSQHMLSAAAALQREPRFGGYVSMAGASRSILETAIEQIRGIQLKVGGDRAKIDKALAAFRAAISAPGSPAPDFSEIPAAAVLWKVIHDPSQAVVAREIIFADPLAAVDAYAGPALILCAEHDVQVPRSDAERIFSTLVSPSKELVVIPAANHVFRVEPVRASEIAPADVLAGYTGDRELAPGTVEALAEFAQRVTRAG